MVIGLVPIAALGSKRESETKRKPGGSTSHGRSLHLEDARNWVMENGRCRRRSGGEGGRGAKSVRDPLFKDEKAPTAWGGGEEEDGVGFLGGWRKQTWERRFGGRVYRVGLEQRYCRSGMREGGLLEERNKD